MDCEIKFPAVFIVGDAADSLHSINYILERNSTVADIKSKVVFDLVSCQMSMHYLFESEERVRGFL